MKNTMFLFILACSLFGCENTINNPQDSIFPKKIWQVPLGPNPRDQKAQDPYVYKNKLIMGYQNLETGFEGYYIYDKQTGKVLKDIPNIPTFDVRSFGIENQYISIVGTRLRVIDLDNYTVKTSFLSSTFLELSKVITKDQFYLTKVGQPNKVPNDYQADICNYDLKAEKLETLYRKEMTPTKGLFGTSSASLTLGRNMKNEEVLYFGSAKHFNSADSISKISVQAYNITQKEVEWGTEEFTVDKNSFANLGWSEYPIYEDKYIIGLGDSSLFAYNIHNGNLVWRTKIPVFGRSIFHNGKIITISMLGLMSIVDASTGKLLRTLNVGFANVFNIVGHKDVVYFATVTNVVMAVDINTGTIKWKMEPPNKCSFCSYGFAYIVVDPETNRLYVSDKKDVMCYQLPK